MNEMEKPTEEKIFESATEVFTEKGLDGARMQDIANHAGINKALLHYYYRTKDQLFNMVFEKIAGKMFEKFAPVLDEKLTLEDKIRFFMREHIEFMERNPRLPIFLLNEMTRNPDRIRKLAKNIEIRKLWAELERQHKDEFEKYHITEEAIPQLMTSIAALSIFPFAARTLISVFMEQMGYNFDDYIQERKKWVPEFIIRGVTK
jgi:TetR/AcrR family transcriptional regulator